MSAKHHGNGEVSLSYLINFPSLLTNILYLILAQDKMLLLLYAIMV